jgi:cell division protein FtsX
MLGRRGAKTTAMMTTMMMSLLLVLVVLLVLLEVKRIGTRERNNKISRT